jgi:hypothetical protein
MNIPKKTPTQKRNARRRRAKKRARAAANQAPQPGGVSNVVVQAAAPQQQPTHHAGVFGNMFGAEDDDDVKVTVEKPETRPFPNEVSRRIIGFLVGCPDPSRVGAYASSTLFSGIRSGKRMGNEKVIDEAADPALPEGGFTLTATAREFFDTALETPDAAGDTRSLAASRTLSAICNTRTGEIALYPLAELTPDYGYYKGNHDPKNQVATTKLPERGDPHYQPFHLTEEEDARVDKSHMDEDEKKYYAANGMPPLTHPGKQPEYGEVTQSHAKDLLLSGWNPADCLGFTVHTLRGADETSHEFTIHYRSGQLNNARYGERLDNDLPPRMRVAIATGIEASTGAKFVGTSSRWRKLMDGINKQGSSVPAFPDLVEQEEQ